MTYLRALLIAALCFVTTHDAAWGQRLESGPQVLTFFSEVDDTDQPYALYVPPNFDASVEYPLVISLHGAGSNHRLNLRRVFGKSNVEGENDVEASRYFSEWEDVNYIVASPLARGTMGYRGVAEADVMNVLADVRQRFPIDANRIYLTGLSMGGGGSLWMGLTRPDIWAAIAPVCPAPPPGTETYAPNARNIPMHFHQGGADPVVSPESVRAWHDRLDSLGTAVEYTEYPGVGHESWENAYADGQIFDWFEQFERDPFPDRVRFATARYKYDRAYWVRLDALTPGTPARIDARFTGPHQLAVTTAALDGFTLFLADHPQAEIGKPLSIQIDGQALDVQVADSLSYRKTDGTWTTGRSEKPGLAKRPGAEGPMSEAVAGRHIYVYGTAGQPSEEAQAARQAQAVEAATWSVYRGPFWGRVKVFPRVVADTLVRESDLETAHLVLFGTRESNRLIQQWGDRLPLHLKPSAEKYGLAYIFPVDGRYVLVNAGVPWWKTGTGGESPFVNQVPALGLMDRPDYMLYRGTADSVLVEGRFDRTWQVPDDDAAAMEASGAVTVTGSGAQQ